MSKADRIGVTLPDRRTFEATLVGSDAGTDIAVLRIEAESLKALELGDSERLKVGDIVLAVNRSLVRSVSEFAAAIRSAQSVIVLSVPRDSSRLLLVVQ